MYIHRNRYNLPLSETLIVLANLAWPVFYRPEFSSERQWVLDRLAASVRHPPQGPLPQGWIQMCSRRPTEDGLRSLIVPWGMVGRLSALDGQLEKAFEALETEVAVEGATSLGARVMLGMMGPLIGRHKESRKYLDEMSLDQAPAASRPHMEDERSFLLAATDSPGSSPRELDVALFDRQARSTKALYYSHAVYTNLIHFFRAGADRPWSRRIALAYAEGMVDAYVRAGHGCLQSITDTKSLIAQLRKSNKARIP